MRRRGTEIPLSLALTFNEAEETISDFGEEWVIKGIQSLGDLVLSKGQNLSKRQHFRFNQTAASSCAVSYSPGLSGFLVLKLLWHLEQLGNWYAGLCLLVQIEEPDRL